MQLKRLELKLKQFAELETILMRECEQVEKTRQRLATERAHAISTRLSPAGSTGSLGPGMTPTPNPRGPTPPTQPGISGYGQQMSQQAHSPMPFMPRQQMGFPHGPRLPLSAINPSSSPSPSNTMFSAPGSNAQPTGLNHSMLRSAPSAGSNLG